MTFEMADSPRMTMAVNGMIRVCREVGLTAGEFMKAADMAGRMVSSAAMSVGLEGLDVGAEDFGAGEDGNFAVVGEE